MANAVRLDAFLRTSASSSTQLSSSSSSSSSRGRLLKYKRHKLRRTRPFRSLSPTPSFRFSLTRCEPALTKDEAQDADFEGWHRNFRTTDHEQVLAERNILKEQLARRNGEIKKLRETVDSALKELSKVVNHLKEIPFFREGEQKTNHLPESPQVKSTDKSELQKVQPITPEVKAKGKRRNDVWGRSNGDDSWPPLKKSHLDRRTGGWSSS